MLKIKVEEKIRSVTKKSISNLSMNLSRLLTRLVYLLEGESTVTVRLPPDRRTDGQATGQMERETRLLAPWEGRRMGQGGKVGGGGGARWVAEHYGRIIFSRACLFFA